MIYIIIKKIISLKCFDINLLGKIKIYTNFLTYFLIREIINV